MSAPVNVKLPSPTIPIPGWADEELEWVNLNKIINGCSDFYPLTIKAAYVIGVIHDLCESVSHLLSHPNAKYTTYIPAYGVFASGVELLGRCINGNQTTKDNTKDLLTGFQWLWLAFLRNHPSSTNTNVPVTTSTNAYTIEMLAALRHFAAHGQATSEKTSAGYKFGNIDIEVLSYMPPLLSAGLEKYWSDLQQDDDLCNKLAQANVIALRDWPIENSWVLFSDSSVTNIFQQFNWHI